MQWCGRKSHGRATGRQPGSYTILYGWALNAVLQLGCLFEKARLVFLVFSLDMLLVCCRQKMPTGVYSLKTTHSLFTLAHETCPGTPTKRQSRTTTNYSLIHPHLSAAFLSASPGGCPPIFAAANPARSETPLLASAPPPLPLPTMSADVLKSPLALPLALLGLIAPSLWVCGACSPCCWGSIGI